MEMKPKRIPLGRNPLSDAPCRNPGLVLNVQGLGRHPRDAPCRDLGAVSSEQGSGRHILSGAPRRRPDVVKNEQGSSHQRRVRRVIISIIGLLLFGKLLEPLWGSKELSKFIFVVNFSTSAFVFVTAIALYYITQQESYLYTPLSGFYGVLSGLLVGIKQLLPDQELNLWVLKIKAKWIPSLVALISVVLSFFVKELVSYLPLLLFGIYLSWIYLRYFQKRLETGLKGDPSEEFSFSSFFPEFLRPVLDPIASIFHRLLCGRSERSDSRGQALDTSLLPGSDSIEANRRRERGQRALEQRLAEKLAAVRSSEGTSVDPADKV